MRTTGWISPVCVCDDDADGPSSSYTQSPLLFVRSIQQTLTYKRIVYNGGTKKKRQTSTTETKRKTLFLRSTCLGCCRPPSPAAACTFSPPYKWMNHIFQNCFRQFGIQIQLENVELKCWQFLKRARMCHLFFLRPPVWISYDQVFPSYRRFHESVERCLCPSSKSPMKF